MTSCTIELGWPSRRLNPNFRQHHMALAKTRKQAKEATRWECIAQGIPRQICAERLVASFTFLPPDNRRRDLDNAIAACKALTDGIAAHIGVDDSKWVQTYEFGEPVKGGKVIVNLRWTPCNHPVTV